ncbi:hypothetical protein GIB67_022679 [Kingdonia uniflora]|uniref:Glycosyltransferase N-terminal domain-containing protein n=1 Tax=Kingdonia uniflora TaxID=39325 RepID=A0A7J7P8C6_9MAGN|nr:hypothetical protein GIB67_022679 [Kingdonia uniflora]
MGSTSANNPHAICIPLPVHGHITPMMQFAKLLYFRGIHITFVNTEFNHRHLLQSIGSDQLKGLPDFQFETISDGLPTSNRNATQDIPSLCSSTQKYLLAPLIDLVGKLKSLSVVPDVTCIVCDALMSTGIKAAKQLGLPEFHLWTSSVCSFMAVLQFRELVKRGLRA